MRRDDAGIDAGRSGRTRGALARVTAPHGGTAAGGHPPAAAAPAARPPTGSFRDLIADAAAGPDLHRGVLTSGSADQLAALVARAAGAPSACIQFVEENRLRLYGSWGVAADWEVLAETGLDRSLGGLVVRHGTTLIVENARADPRIDDGLLRRGGGAYLGCPVHDRSGAVLGVCFA